MHSEPEATSAAEAPATKSIKALTVCQPYAELIARGEKLVENRTWPTRYRGPIAIHAGKSRSWMEPEDAKRYPDMAFGAVIAVADLVACLSTIYPADTANWPARWRHLADHEHANGPFCFVLENVRRIEPVPCRGAQGFWEWVPPSIGEAQSVPTPQA